MFYLEIKGPYAVHHSGEFEDDKEAQKRAEEIVTRGLWVGDTLILPHQISHITIKENGTGE